LKSFTAAMLLIFIIASLPFLVIDFKTAEAETVFTDDFSTDSGAWQYLGSAYRDQTNQYLVLTTSSNDQTGLPFLELQFRTLSQLASATKVAEMGSFCSSTNRIILQQSIGRKVMGIMELLGVV
jgi:hypothetical protein